MICLRKNSTDCQKKEFNPKKKKHHRWQSKIVCKIEKGKIIAGLTVTAVCADPKEESSIAKGKVSNQGA